MLLGVGVYLARRRPRAVLGVGLGVVAGMVVLAGALMVGRAVVVGGVPEQGVAAAAAGYDILVRFVYAALRTLATLGWSLPSAGIWPGARRGRCRFALRWAGCSRACAAAGSVGRSAQVRSGRGSTPTVACCGGPPSGSPCSCSSFSTDPAASTSCSSHSASSSRSQ
jgi:hypothetical protein